MRLCSLGFFSSQNVLKTQRTLYFFLYFFLPVNVLSSFVFVPHVSFSLCLFLFLLHREVQCLQFGRGMTKSVKILTKCCSLKRLPFPFVLLIPTVRFFYVNYDNIVCSAFTLTNMVLVYFTEAGPFFCCESVNSELKTARG